MVGLTEVSAALSRASVWSFVAYHVVHSLVSTSVFWRASPWRPGFRPSLAALRRVAAYAVLSFRLVTAARTANMSWALVLRRMARIIGAALAMSLVVFSVGTWAVAVLAPLPRVLLEVMTGTIAYIAFLALCDRALVAFIIQATRSFVTLPRIGQGRPAQRLQPLGEKRARDTPLVLKENAS